MDQEIVIAFAVGEYHIMTAISRVQKTEEEIEQTKSSFVQIFVCSYFVSTKQIEMLAEYKEALRERDTPRIRNIEFRILTTVHAQLHTYNRGKVSIEIY